MFPILTIEKKYDIMQYKNKESVIYMEKDLKDAKNFTKDLVRKPTQEEITLVNKMVNKKELLTRIFFVLCTAITITGTIVFGVDIFKHAILDYHYISIILTLFFATFAFCFIYDAIYRVKEFLQMKNGDFYVADGKITKVVFTTEQHSIVTFKSETGFEDGLKYQLRGKWHKVNDEVIFVALFNEKDELQLRMLLAKTK